jgi:type III pantothenate kinase
MQSGLYFGYVGQVSVLIDRIQAELGGDARVVATGGFASVIRSEIDAIDHTEPHLVLIGLRILYHRNKRT